MPFLQSILLVFTFAGGCQPAAEQTPMASWVRVDGDSGSGGSGSGGSGSDSAAATDSGDDTSGDPADDSGLPAGATVVYAVRHAEKQTDGADPGLTKEGQARAEALVDIMADVPLVAVYATEKARTQETVEPTATDHGLKVITDVDPEDELAKLIVSEHSAQTVLHAGHSYSLPDFFDAIGAKEADSVSGYGQLWIITIDKAGAIGVEMSTYGE